MYKYHYIDRIRPEQSTSALFFGKALDEALNVMLMGGQDYHEVFDKHWARQEYNGEVLDLKTTDKIKYFKVDGDWETCSKRGHLFLDAYKKEVMPKITKVIAVQKEIEITNADGDKITGIVDLVAEFEGVGTIILDNKSASKNYPKDAIEKSQQLHLYAHALGIDNVGFIVLNKVLKKDDKVGIQYLFGKVDEVGTDLILSRVDEANHGIANKVFDKNKKSCYNFGKCPYYDLCYNGDSKGLIKIEYKTEAK